MKIFRRFYELKIDGQQRARRTRPVPELQRPVGFRRRQKRAVARMSLS